MGVPCECSGQRTVQEHHGSKGAPRSPIEGGNTMGCLRGPGAKGGLKKNRVRCKCENILFGQGEFGTLSLQAGLHYSQPKWTLQG